MPASGSAPALVEKTKMQKTILILTLFATANCASAGEITVSTAMSLKNAFAEIKAGYESAHAGEKANLNLGPSGGLANQIIAGAPVDVFASASQKDMNRLREKKFLIETSGRNFATNTMILVKPANSGIQIETFHDLLKNEVGKISVGNPKTVPAGRYARQVLIDFGVWDRIKDKLVLAENVRQVLDYTYRNEVDAGIVYATDFRIRPKGLEMVATAPEKSHEPIVYPISVLRDAGNVKSAEMFVAFVMSEKGKAILAKHGFGCPPEEKP